MLLAWRKTLPVGVLVGPLAGAGTAAAQVSIGSLIRLFGVGIGTPGGAYIGAVKV